MRGIFVLALLVSGAAFADDEADLANAAKSPQDLARFVDTHTEFDWAPLWKALDIPEHRVFLGPCQQLGAERICKTELIDIEKSTPAQVILVLFDGRDGVVYLRYFGSGATPKKWRFGGFYDSTVAGAAPEHGIVTIGKKPFLRVVSSVAASGVEGRLERWLDLSHDAVNVVFAFQPSGHVPAGGVGLNRAWSGSVVSTMAEPHEEIRVTQTVRFWLQQESGRFDLGERTDTLVYRRDVRFLVDAKESTVSRHDAQLLYSGDSFTPADFIRWDLEALKKIAAGPESPQRSWLAEFVKQCSATAERKALEALLR